MTTKVKVSDAKKEEKRQEKIDALQFIVNSGSDRKLRTSYSGRCMYGKTCYGITCDSYDTNDVIAEAGAAGIMGARTDSMGRGTIVYWPSIEGENDDDSDD